MIPEYFCQVSYFRAFINTLHVQYKIIKVDGKHIYFIALWVESDPCNDSGQPHVLPVFKPILNAHLGKYSLSSLRILSESKGLNLSSVQLWKYCKIHSRIYFHANSERFIENETRQKSAVSVNLHVIEKKVSSDAKLVEKFPFVSHNSLHCCKN